MAPRPQERLPERAVEKDGIFVGGRTGMIRVPTKAIATWVGHFPDV
ncbi:MAG TPA: hypothetical protein VE079_01610 [Ensifer sp.]|nr:hypothetical protein [Ensifer sp.]